VAALGVLLVLSVLGVGVLSGGAVGQGSAALKADPAAAEAVDPTPSGEPDPTAATDDTSESSPGRYRVVEALRIKPAPEPKQDRLGLAERAEQARAATPAISDFGVAMLNILGSQHTAGADGYASGTSRAYSATQMLLGRGVSIVGFSEIQSDQLAVFTNNAPSFGVYPGTSLGSAGVPTTLAWDTRVWRLVSATTLTIPFSGQQRLSPVVKLANVATGAEVYVLNFHNSPGGMEGERDAAQSIELAKIRELEATGVPIIVTGDFNEKLEALCAFTATSLQSAVGGGYCYPPPYSPRVDWIFASESFSVNSYEVTRAAPVPYITDHHALFARLSLQ
jgi:hypothetical protein